MTKQTEQTTITAQTIRLIAAMNRHIKTGESARAFFVRLYGLDMEHSDVLEFIDAVNAAPKKDKPAVRKLLASASGARKLKSVNAQWHFTSKKGNVTVCSGDPTPRGTKGRGDGDESSDKPKGEDSKQSLINELREKIADLEAQLAEATRVRDVIVKGCTINSKTGRVSVTKPAVAVIKTLKAA